jgi:hypothetical protein
MQLKVRAEKWTFAPLALCVVFIAVICLLAASGIAQLGGTCIVSLESRGSVSALTATPALQAGSLSRRSRVDYSDAQNEALDVSCCDGRLCVFDDVL